MMVAAVVGSAYGASQTVGKESDDTSERIRLQWERQAQAYSAYKSDDLLRYHLEYLRSGVGPQGTTDLQDVRAELGALEPLADGLPDATSPVEPIVPVPVPDLREPASLRALICSFSWPCEEALAIVYGPTPVCPTGESNGDPEAVSWNGTSYGLWQINSIHAWRWPDFWKRWPEPMRNTEYAYELWAEQGFVIWDCSP